MFLGRFGIMLVVSILAGAAAWADEPATKIPCPTGYRPPDPVEWQEHLKRSREPLARKTASLTAPAAARVPMQWLPPVGNQLYGNCGAWPAAYYMKTYYEAREHGWLNPSPAVDPEHVMSVAFPYSLEYKPTYEGSNPAYIGDVLKYYGTATWSERPESSGYSAPTEAQWRSAARYRISDWYALNIGTVDGRETAKTLIAAGDPIGTGWGRTTGNIDAYAGGDADGVSNDVLYAYSTWGDPARMNVGHAITIIGYDDNKAYTVGAEARQGAWLIVNQWGTGWGVKADPDSTRGYMWIAYDMLGSGQVLVDRIGYEPKDFFVYKMRADVPGYANVELVYGDPAVPALTMNLFYAQSMNAWDTTVAEDISDYHDQLQGLWNWRLRLFCVETTSASRAAYPPGIGAARIEIEGRPPAEFTGLPLTGQDMTWVWVDQCPNIRTDGIFKELLTNTHGQALWTDWNGDGRDEMYFSHVKTTPQVVYVPDGSGRYDPVNTDIPLSYNVSAIADFDNNGRTDILTFIEDPPQCRFDLYLQDDLGRLLLRTHVLPDLCGASLSPADVNNDGAIDVLLTGGQYVGPDYVTESRVWLNNGDATFRKSGITLNPCPLDYVRWADFDQDGWIDCLLDNRLYRNLQGQSFEARGSLPVAAYSAVAGDFTGDGAPDLAALASGQTQLLSNAGDFAFESVQTLPGFVDFNAPPQPAFWGDFDNDGRLDFLQSGIVSLSGSFFSAPRAVQFFRQKTDGTFDRPGLVFPPLATGVVTGGDVDGDGNLDFYVSGMKTTPSSEPQPAVMPWDSAWYKNSLPTFAGIASNTAPSAPTGLSVAVVDVATGEVEFSWSHATDDQTSPAGLGYRVRVGTIPGGNRIVSDASVHDVSGLWLSPGSPGRRLRGLPVGRYYGSVRAVDTSWVAGPWSAEISFAIGAPGGPGDVNHDGEVDIADYFHRLRIDAGQEPLDLSACDVDQDGVLDDAETLTSLILGKRWTKVEIGAEGGVVAAPGIRLTIPYGSFTSGDATVSLLRSESSPMAEGSASPSFQIRGLPINFEEPLTLELRLDPGAVASPDMMVALSEQGFRRDSSQMKTSWKFLKPSSVGQGWVRVSIPSPQDHVVFPAPRGSSLEDFPMDEFPPFEVKAVALTIVENERWRITVPRAHAAMIPRAQQALDRAYDTFSQDPYYFKYTRRTLWPMDVTFLPMDPESDGGQVSSRWGDDYSYMEFNTKFLDHPDGYNQDPTLDILAGHEFLHFVQGLYDSRNRVSKSSMASDHYWIDEMTATWAESLFTTDTLYIPGVTQSHQNAPLGGLPLPNFTYALSSRTHIAHQGYGLAPLFKYLVNHHGPGVLLAMYQKLYLGVSPPTAIATSLGSGAPDNYLFWSGFVREWMDPNLLYQFNGHRQDLGADAEFGNFATPKHIIDLSDPKQHAMHIYPTVGPVGINGICIEPLRAALTHVQEPGTTLMIRLKTRPDTLILNACGLSVKYGTINYSTTVESPEVQRVDIGNLADLADKNYFIAASLTNTMDESWDDSPDVDVALLRTGTYAIPAFSVGAYRQNSLKWPVYQFTGTLNYAQCGPIETYDCGGYCHSVSTVVWAQGNKTFDLDLNCAQSSADTFSENEGSLRMDYQIAGTPRYQLIRRNPQYNTIYQTLDSATPSFDLGINVAMNYQLYDVILHVDFNRKTYSGAGELLADEMQTAEIPVYSTHFWIGDRNWQEPEEVPFDPTQGH